MALGGQRYYAKPDDAVSDEPSPCGAGPARSELYPIEPNGCTTRRTERTSLPRSRWSRGSSDHCSMMRCPAATGGRCRSF